MRDAQVCDTGQATDVGTGIPLASRPFNDASLDMGRPPQTSRAYSRTGRAALAAGTLGTVGDHTAREDVHRNVEVRHADGYDSDVVHADILAASEVWAQRRAPTASIIVKARGTRTRATATTEGCSFFSLLGDPWAVQGGRTWLPLANSYGAHGLSIAATDRVGVSGAPRERAV